ncbi:hypothetical protein M1L60_19290 [Actinoplanes sp. TRM 88003]|uniref:Uncharacterized protein n=1 Tax=Paractinoplanes aksuensis TaxID=2939490 RepID=A0ABT1DQH4_9ACTN|nr:hypothetical protein [Actinoplanes aksuensis]MCO8272743.1 hypothetical protein [Actinoplanes aksuensis]
MKFFSNEKETETETEPQADPDRTQPVAVPPQRAGSPWSDAPRDASSPSSSSSDPDVVEDKTVTSTTYGPDGSVVEDDNYRVTNSDKPRDDSPVDLPLTDSDTRPAEEQAIKDDGTFDSPKAVDPATGDKLDETDKSDSSAADSSDKVNNTDLSEATDRADRADRADRLDSEDFQRASDTPASPVAETAAVPVAAAAPATPAPAAGTKSTGDKLLPDGDSFAERFRDIQLRFVDEPKEATAEAATLVGDAVDKLTSALKAQRDGLAGNSDDTEKLRVELRAYREILNRLLAL